MSRHNHIALHHISSKQQLNLFDRSIIAAVFLSPLSAVPQVIEVLSGRTDGLSLFSWISFTVFALMFLVYGIIHKLMPVIIANGIWLIVDGLVVAGIIYYRFIN